MQALKVAAMLANGMGGFDWCALPLACRVHAVRDIELLIERLQVIKAHRPDAKAKD